MLRAVAKFYIEGPALELVRRDVYKGFRTAAASSAATTQTVLSAPAAPPAASSLPLVGPPSPPSLPPPPPPPPSPPRRGAWPLAAALALSVSIGGVYLYKKTSDSDPPTDRTARQEDEEEEPPYPEAEGFPEHVQYLIVGGGTAAFAALRALRAARPTAQVLVVGEEHALPYMRPPLSKELWAEPALADAARRPDRLSFRQWNGKRRALTYEPPAFYTPVERLAGREGGGVGVARGWTVTRVADGAAELRAPGRPAVSLRYERCLLATGVRPRRVPALRAAAAAGRSLAVRTVRDVARAAELLDRADTRRVVVVGGGFLACELTAALADRLAGSGKRVVQVFREEAAMARVLPRYLARDATRRLRECGARVLPGCSVEEARVEEGRVTLHLADGRTLEAELVLECAGAEPDEALARASRLETHAELRGVLVNAELAARSDVWAAGDVACFYDELLGRRRVEHHDHAVVSGRLAGENMAGVGPAKRYAHQSMFWSDLGPHLGYEAIGIVDSSLPTVGVFAEEAVSAVAESRTLAAAAGAPPGAGGPAPAPAPAPEPESEPVSDAERARYERGVVFYLREHRVVGVLLWNLFNRMHIARQVLSVGEFEDLLEVGKLFSPQLAALEPEPDSELEPESESEPEPEPEPEPNTNTQKEKQKHK